MAPLCYRRHRFPPEIIQHAIWLYLRFTLSYRDVEDLLADRGLDISYETMRRWVLKFGPAIARRLRRRRPRPSDRWHLDEMVVRITRRVAPVNAAFRLRAYRESCTGHGLAAGDLAGLAAILNFATQLGRSPCGVKRWMMRASLS
jgi:hypothetical protein